MANQDLKSIGSYAPNPKLTCCAHSFERRL
jgi:hypothetical protein